MLDKSRTLAPTTKLTKENRLHFHFIYLATRRFKGAVLLGKVQRILRFYVVGMKCRRDEMDIIFHLVFSLSEERKRNADYFG